MKHKHYDVILAFAEGKKIEYRTPSADQWREIKCPSFHLEFEYRVKPEPKTKTLGQLLRIAEKGDCGDWDDITVAARALYEKQANVFLKLVKEEQLGV